MEILCHWNGLWILSQIGLLILGAFPVQQELSLAKQYIATWLLKYKSMKSWRLMRRTILSILLCTCACMHTIFYWVSTLIYPGFFACISISASGISKHVLYELIWDKIQWSGLKYWREFCQGPYCLHMKLWFFSAEKIICFHF